MRCAVGWYLRSSLLFRAPSTPKSRHAQSRVDRPARPSESSPPVAGEFSSASKERASRRPAETSWSRAAVRRLAVGLLLVVAGLLGVSAAAQAQTEVWSGTLTVKELNSDTAFQNRATVDLINLLDVR